MKRYIPKPENYREDGEPLTTSDKERISKKPRFREWIRLIITPKKSRLFAVFSGKSPLDQATKNLLIDDYGFEQDFNPQIDHTSYSREELHKDALTRSNLHGDEGIVDKANNLRD